MKTTLFKNWWLLTLKGILAVLFGIIAFTVPDKTILVLTIYFGALILVGGIVHLGWLLFSRPYSGKAWPLLLLDGGIDIIIGILVLLYPEITVKIFVLFIALWLLFIGSLQIIYALIVRKRLNAWLLPLLNGIITFLLGLLIWQNPFVSSLALSYLIGVAALLFGILLIFTSLALRRWNAAEED